MFAVVAAHLCRRKAEAIAQVVFMPTVRSVLLRRLGALAVLCTGSLVLAAPRAAAAALPDVPAARLAADESTEYTKAQTLFHDRKFKEAIALLDPYIALHPRDARALVLRGDCKADLGDNESALKDYNSAIKIEPEYQYAYVTRCETRLQLEDREGALRDCDNAIRLDAADALAYEDRADVHFQREAYDLALTDYDKAIQLGRSSAYVYAARCDTERLTGKQDRAKADCEKALAIDPKSRRGLWARGRLALVQTRYRDGIADFNAYIAQNPKGSDTAYYFRALAFNRIESFKLALEDIQTYVQRHSDDPDGYRERAVASYGSGNKDGALADLATALRYYRKAADSAAVARVTKMADDIRAGRSPAPP
jgi:tetratricopeptide (TPR) repeat protein